MDSLEIKTILYLNMFFRWCILFLFDSSEAGERVDSYELRKESQVRCNKILLEEMYRMKILEEGKRNSRSYCLCDRGSREYDIIYLSIFSYTFLSV